MIPSSSGLSRSYRRSIFIGTKLPSNWSRFDGPRNVDAARDGGGPLHLTPAPEPLGRLIQEAIASDPGERIEQYRDRLAALGNEVVQPLLTVERQQPALGLFVTAV